MSDHEHEPLPAPRVNLRLLLLGAVLISLTAGLGLQLWSAFDNARRQRDERAARLAALQRGPVARGFADDSLIEVASEVRLATARSAFASVAAQRVRKQSWRFWDQSLPTPETIRTQATVAEEYLRFRLRELEAYRTRTQDQGPARTAGEAFLDAYLRQVATRRNDPRAQPGLRDLATKAIDAGSRDPMIRVHHANLQWEGGRDREECRTLLLEALRDLADSGYPRIVASYGRLYLRDFIPAEDSDRRVAALRDALPALVAWLEEEAADPAWTRSSMERVSRLYRSWPAADRRLFLLALTEARAIDPYIPHTLLGEVFMDQGWSSRGWRWAAQVRPDQWKGFEKYMQMATDHLEYAWSLRPDLPYAPALMIQIAMGGQGSGEGTRFWFLQTIEAQYDDASAYESYLFSLTTRWGGRPGLILGTGRFCLETDRFDTRIPYMALEAVDTHRIYELDKGETLANAPDAVELLRKFLTHRKAAIAGRGMAALHEADGSYRSLLLRLLESAGLRHEAALLLTEVGEDLNWIDQRKDNRPGRYLAARLVAEDAGDAAAIAAFDDRLRGPLLPGFGPADVALLETEWTALRGRAPAQPGPHDYFRHAEAMLGQLRDFAAGNWVALRAEAPLWGWEPYADEWFADPEVGVTLSARAARAPLVCLRPLIGLQPPFEAEAVLVIPDPAPYPGAVGIGWSREGDAQVFSRPQGLTLGAVEASLSMRHPEKKLERRDRGYVSHVGWHSANFPLEAGVPHRIKFKTWGTEVEFQVDDLARSEPLPAGLESRGWLAFGTVSPQDQPESRGRRAGAVIFRDVRFRRLDAPRPPAAGLPREERLQYWSARMTRDPADLIAAVQVARLRVEGEEFEAALAGADAIRQQWPRANKVPAIRGAALKGLRRYEEALREFEAAGEEWEDDPESDGHWGEILSSAPQESLRDPQRGLSKSEFAVRIARTPHTCAAFAAAQAAQGNFEQAVALQEEAIRGASEGQLAEFRERLTLYQNKQPYRLPEPAAEK